MIFQDFSVAVLCKRKRFYGVKKRLKSIGAVYTQVYPASLRVTVGGVTQMFQDPAAVAQYVDSLELTPIVSS